MSQSLKSAADAVLNNAVNASPGVPGVVAVATEKEFATKFQNGDFDAVVLCHTLPDDQRKRIAELVRAHSASTPVVAMSDGAFHGSTGLNGDQSVVFGDTRDLLRVLPEVLRSSEQRRVM